MADTRPSVQHRYEGLPELSEQELYWRRETVFLFFAGIFLGTLAMLNILGISRFIDLSFELPLVGTVPMPLAVGVLPYPITFLCTDFICEIYGRQRANFVVFMGLVLNIWVMTILWLGGILPGAPGEQPGVFFEMRTLAFGAVAASMIAYLVAQLVDVRVFHFWKDLTRGRHLWLRNNGSTLVSQLVDTTAVILITHYYAHALPMVDGESVGSQLMTFIVAGYMFKVMAALVDTLPFYLGVHRLQHYLRLPPTQSSYAQGPAAAGGTPEMATQKTVSNRGLGG